MKKKTERWQQLLLIVLTACLIFTWSLRKEGMFLDEVYSYGLSNSTGGPFVTRLHDEWENGTVFERSELLDYVSVAENERFDYAAVYYNQTQDVHPPLFYFFLHTVCSLFPGSFTKWTGIGLNFAFLGCTLAAMYALAMELMQDAKKALFACALYAFSTQAVTYAIMIRMYMLLTLLTVLLALLVAKSLHRPSVGKCLAIGLVIYLGMMTQYFYVIYAFLLCAAYDLYRIYQRKWKDVFLFSVPALAGVGGMLLTFPSWYAQLHSQKEVSLQTTISNALNLLEYPVKAGTMLLWHAVAFWTGAVILVGMIVVVIARKIRPQNTDVGIHFSAELKLITVPAFIALLVIAIIAPYQATRYITHLEPLEAIFLSCGFFEIVEPLQQRKKIALGFLTVAFVVSLVFMEPEFIYRGAKKQDAMLEAHAGEPCVLVSAKRNPAVTSLIPQLLYFDDVCITDDLSNDILKDYLAGKPESGGVVLIVATYPQVQLTDDEVQEFGDQKSYQTIKKLSEKDYATIYLLQKDE